MVMEEVIPGPAHILQHIQGASIDLPSQTQRSPTPLPAQRSPGSPVDPPQPVVPPCVGSSSIS
eukprot:4864893-Pyramimonas_sp.AAC.1